MTPPRLRAALLTIAVLSAAFLPLRHAGETRYDPAPSVSTNLPSRVGPWAGDPMRYCGVSTCDTIRTVSELDGGTNCPVCGGPLASMAAIERQLLPADTVVQRSRYSASQRPDFYATVVLSGRERSSIHRPEVCLSVPGTEIVGSESMQVELPGRRPLELRVLTLKRTTPGGPSWSFYAYWFAAKDHETASHSHRMALMAYDRVFHNLTRRWAYISVAGPLTPGSTAHVDDLRDFVRALHPQLRPD